MANKLSVKNLIISFRTNNGTVKAVRDVSFDLEKGETLAVVGESGSGKSVTVRAIMGILAGNAIVEGGEIIYDGMDLLKIPEDEFHHIRGNRISMIFQDPLSALNPVIRIGKQLTEAMILNGRMNQKNAGREYKKRIKLLVKAMNGAYERGYAGAIPPEKVSEGIATLKKFVAVGNRYEAQFNAAYENATSLLNAIKHIEIELINGEPKAVAKLIERAVDDSNEVYNDFLVKKDGKLPALVAQLTADTKSYRKSGDTAQKEPIRRVLDDIKALLETAVALPKPNFFGLGYYIANEPDVQPDTDDIEGLNAMTHKKLDDEFMIGFLKGIEAGIKYSYDNSIENKKAAVGVLQTSLSTLEAKGYDKAMYKTLIKTTASAVEGAIDRLDIDKDSYAYTFRSSLSAAMNTYIQAKHLSGKKHTAKKHRDFVANMDMELYRHNITLVIQKVIDTYNAQIKKAENANFRSYGVRLVDHLKDTASKMVYKVTKSMAKNRAISLMEEVGIPDARKRYRQYPFQFSGGMRQRIVIAIALSANPDILICDEPTTALDVTIQAQILDLIKGLKRDRQLTVIFITHALGVVANMADRIAVMYAGKIVEYGTADEIFYKPAHPYTWALLSSMPDLETKEKLEAIPGTPPDMIYPPKGDAFAPRNKYALKIDFEKQPPFFDISDTHRAATWLLHPDAPKVVPPKIVTERIERMKKYGGGSNG